jgi:hypothetical protein
LHALIPIAKKKTEFRRPTAPMKGWDKSDRRYPRIAVPLDFWEAARKCAELESKTFGRKVSISEEVARAIIERVGQLFGEQYARHLYNCYFNGLVGIKARELPAVSRESE